MQKTNLYLYKIIKNNVYLILLIFLLFFTILITNFYSINKNKNESSLINFLDNSYLKKSINLIVNNLTPKFVYIDFEIGKGDTFEKVIKQLDLPLTEKNILVLLFLDILLLLIFFYLRKLAPAYAPVL